MTAAPFDAPLAQAYADMAAGRTPQAIERLRLLTTEWPGHAGAHVMLGIALERVNQLGAAATCYAKALGIMPDLVEPALRLSTLLVEASQREAAAQLLHRAADKVPPGTRAQLIRVAALGLEERHTDIISTLRDLLCREPHISMAWRLLADALAVDGQLNEADAAMRRALLLSPNDATTLYDFVRLTKVTEADRVVLDRMQHILSHAHGLPPRQRLLLGFSLGKGYDDLGEYELAMRAFDSANEIRRAMHPFNRAAWDREVDKRIAAFTPQVMTRHAGKGRSDGRAIFIVGMPRSGTTLVEQILSSHPAVAAGGEMSFWGRKNSAWFAATDEAEQTAFLAQIAQENSAELSRISGTAARVTDKNPYNFIFLGLIRLALPNAFIVHCRRHPVDTCLSCYTTAFSGGNEHAGSRDDLVFFYQGYQRLMAHWRTVLPPDRFIEVDYEALVADQESVTRQLLEFCQLPWHPDCLAPERNRRPVATASLTQARQPIYASSVARWRRYEPWLGTLRSLMPKPQAPLAS